MCTKISGFLWEENKWVFEILWKEKLPYKLQVADKRRSEIHVQQDTLEGPTMSLKADIDYCIIFFSGYMSWIHRLWMF